MRFIFYRKPDHLAAERLQGIIEEFIPPEKIDLYQSIEGLAQGLYLPTGEPTIAVLVAANHKDLQDILSVRNLIAGFRTILIVPDSRKETIARGHRLLPRYLGFAGDDLADFAAVLSKTIRVVQKEGNGWRHE